MEQNLKVILYAVGAMILAPHTLHAQSENIKGLDSLRLYGSILYHSFLLYLQSK